MYGQRQVETPVSRGTTWSPEQRQQALELYRKHGAATAGQQLGIPAGTIRRWASENGERTLRRETSQASIDATKLRWEERRQTLIHDMGRVAQKALQTCEDGLDTGKTRDAQAAATTLAILIDKAQLLSGGATSRPNINPGELLDKSRGAALALVPQRKAV